MMRILTLYIIYKLVDQHDENYNRMTPKKVPVRTTVSTDRSTDRPDTRMIPNDARYLVPPHRLS